VFIIGLSFDAKNSHVGLVVTSIFLVAFVAWGVISFGAVTTIVTSIIGALSVMNFVTKSRKETGGD
jgi:hypothetical protein